MSQNLGIYLHIPFCRSKCPYCDFFSMRASEHDYNNYIDALKRCIHFWSSKIDKTVDTIYIGGGTPSLLSACQIVEILTAVKSSFDCSANTEITIEANPKSAVGFDFELARQSGLNRVSLGVQSANENELRLLGRLHNKNEVETAIEKIKNCGINNISLDLMLGIPKQTINSLKNSIDFCTSQDVKHISVYVLKIEENTVFYKNRNKYNFPDDDKTAELYLFAAEYLAEYGFEQYEISNFCKKGYESIHNLKYWNLDEYLGIGPSAHSYLNGKRFYYERSIESFSANKIIEDGEGGNQSEYIMLQLRLKNGLNLNKYKEVFGELPDKDFFKKTDKYLKLGLLEFKNDTISFTKNGFLVSNSILADLI
ncbi:MAG: radical SAM family heme chaperone HemW [Ruminococcus sp.]|nr:radical SAM family heme chaperone HemW [Ruminococcus sp.]